MKLVCKRSGEKETRGGIAGKVKKKKEEEQGRGKVMIEVLHRITQMYIPHTPRCPYEVVWL